LGEDVSIFVIRRKVQIGTESGFSLVELLVVVMIIVIVASVALMSGRNANQSFKRQNAARELKAALERARFDSVKRRADEDAPTPVPRAHVIVTSNQFTLVTDENSDGDLTDPLDSKVTTFSNNVTLAARTGLSLPVTIYFNRRGEPSEADVRFVVCDASCTYDTASPSIANLLQLTATGTVNLLPGGAPVPTFSPPGVTTVGAGTQIRSQTYISPTPTP
jgi:prepilin-type N-terminal cleavage/methylation domain-containing protein